MDIGIFTERLRFTGSILKQLDEAFGSGIPKMTEIYHQNGQMISFKTSPSGFMIILPNLNYSKESRDPRLESVVPQDEDAPLEDRRMKSARDLILAKGPVSRMDLEAVWDIGRSAAAKWIDQLMDKGLLIRVGNAQSTKYKLPDR